MLVRRIEFALFAFQFDGEHVFELVRQIGQHVFFQTSLNEQSDQSLQFVSHDGMFRTGCHDRLFVFFSELRVGSQQSGHEEVEDAPQFAQPVFDGGSRQCEPVFGGDLFDGFRQLRGMVFDVLRLIERHQCEPAGGVIIHVAAQ